MALSEVIVTTIGTITVAAIGAWGLKVKNKNKTPVYTKEEIIKHSLFSTLYAWKVEGVHTLTIKDPKKDCIMQRYAETLVDTYLAELKDFTTTLSKDNVVPVTKFYLNMVQAAHDALYKSGIPEVFIQQVFEFTASLRNNTFLEIQAFEQSDADYFNKVYASFKQIKFFVGTLLDGLPQTTSKLNGVFEKALETWEPTCGK